MIFLRGYLQTQDSLSLPGSEPFSDLMFEVYSYDKLIYYWNNIFFVPEKQIYEVFMLGF